MTGLPRLRWHPEGWLVVHDPVPREGLQRAAPGDLAETLWARVGNRPWRQVWPHPLDDLNERFTDDQVHAVGWVEVHADPAGGQRALAGELVRWVRYCAGHAEHHPGYSIANLMLFRVRELDPATAAELDIVGGAELARSPAVGGYCQALVWDGMRASLAAPCGYTIVDDECVRHGKLWRRAGDGA